MKTDSLATSRSCPNCGADLRGDPIPEESLHFYNNGPRGELIHSAEEYTAVRAQIEDETTHYRRVIGVQYRSGYDGVSEWLCPDCGCREGRWSGRILVDDELEPRFGGIAEQTQEAA